MPPSTSAFRRKSIVRSKGEDDGTAPVAPHPGIRKMSVYGNKNVPAMTVDNDSDDEPEEIAFGEYDYIDAAAIDALPKPDFGDDVFRSVTDSVELQRLPPIVRDKDKSKRQESFLAKIKQCCVVYDFTEQANPVDYATFATSKQVKKNALNELINYVANNKDVLNDVTLEAVVDMVGTNLFRDFATGANPYAPPFDPEDDEPVLEPAWPHMHLVYTFFLRCLESKSVTSDIYSRVVDPKWIQRFIELCGSLDPRERDIAKACVHRMYGRFMPIRANIRGYMRTVFTRHSNSVYHEAFHGISELLEFYGCIVSGFVAPLKQEHQDMLLHALMPLHRKKQLTMYHRQLVHIISQFLTKENSLGPPVLAYIYRFWPKGNSQKQVLYLNEMQSVLQALGMSFPPLLIDFCKKIAYCIESYHFMVSERALAYFHLQSFVRLITERAEEVFPILVPAVYRNSKRHWSGAIHDHNEHAIEVLNGIDADLYMQYSGHPVAAKDIEVDLERLEIEEKWDAIAALARKNPLAKQIGVHDGPPIHPSYTPDIFMKGETTSPKRQVRQHRRQSLIALEPLRNADDVAAIQKAKQEDQNDDEDDDDDDNTDMVAPVRSRPGLIRKKSKLEIRDAPDTHEELNSYPQHQLTKVPPSPQQSTSPPPSPSPSEPSSPPPELNSDSEVDDWEPLAVAPDCTDGCWMVKRKSGMFKRSRRRWFVLQKENARVAYYLKKVPRETSEPAKGYIMFSDVLEVRTEKRQLIIGTPARRFALTSASTLITDQWAHTLGDALQKHDARERTITEEDEPNGVGLGDGARSTSPGGDFYGFDSPPTTPPNEAVTDEIPSSTERSMSGLKRSLSVDSDDDGRLVDTGIGGNDWFAGKITKEECNRLVAAANEGDFLVREMKSGGKYVVCVNDSGTPVNYTIKKDPTQGNKYKYGSELCDDIISVVDLMRVQPPSNKSGKRLWLMEAAPVTAASGADVVSQEQTTNGETSPEEERKSPLSRERAGSVYGFGDDLDGPDELEA